MVKAQVDRVPKLLIASARAMMAASWEPFAMRSSCPGLAVDERGSTLTDGPCLRRVRERVGPLIVIVIYREPPSDLGLNPHDRVVLRLTAPWPRVCAYIPLEGKRASVLRTVGNTTLTLTEAV